MWTKKWLKRERERVCVREREREREIEREERNAQETNSSEGKLTNQTHE